MSPWQWRPNPPRSEGKGCACLTGKMEGAGSGSNASLRMTVTSRPLSPQLKAIILITRLRVTKHQHQNRLSPMQVALVVSGSRSTQWRKSQEGSRWRRGGLDWVTPWFLLNGLWSSMQCTGTESGSICPEESQAGQDGQGGERYFPEL